MSRVIEAPAPSVVDAPESDRRFEIVDGERVEMPPMSAYENSINVVLCERLIPFASAKHLGRVFPEMLFRFAADLPQRRPDTAFVSFARWPRGRRVPSTTAWEVVPDLAVEVISPTELAVEVYGKVAEYFRAGVQAVWVVVPPLEQVYVYGSPTAVRILSRTDELDGGAVLPGFRLPLAALFETEEAPPA